MARILRQISRNGRRKAMYAPKNVLVCEDDPVQMKVMTAALRRAGYNAVEARGPSEALAAVGGCRPRAVIADVQLDQGNAFDLINGLRRSGHDAPVIMMSAYATPDMRRRAARAGAADFFQKPCDPFEVVRRMERAIAERPQEGIGARVMIVEDNPQLLALYAAVLRQAGCEVVQAKDGHGALEAVRSAAPSLDMILMDMHVPGPCGAGLVAELRKALPGIFVAMLTGEADRDEIAEGYRAGASALIRKPAGRPELISFVKSNLRAARESLRKAERAARRSRAPWYRRAAWWINGLISAPPHSRRRNCMATAAVSVAFIAAALATGNAVYSGFKTAEEYRRKAGQALEKACMHAEISADEARASRVFQNLYLAHQIGLGEETNEINRRYQERQLDLQRMFGPGKR